MRSYALGDEAALLMASYPKTRPVNPFPYFTEVMTGFEYTAAVGMLQEGQIENGLKCISNIHNRYDGRKRSPFDEAECGAFYEHETGDITNTASRMVELSNLVMTKGFGGWCYWTFDSFEQVRLLNMMEENKEIMDAISPLSN